MTMQQFRDFIMAQGLHKYHYDENISGCLTWVTGVIERAEQLGHVTAGTTVTFREYCDDLRIENGLHWIPNDHGEWFI